MGALNKSGAKAKAASGQPGGAKLSKASIFFLGVDGIIGSGIFLLPGALYKGAGTMTLGLIILGAVAVLLFGFCYAEMAARTTGNGGAWLYAYNAFGKFTGFQVGFFTWIQGVATIATETAAFLTAIAILNPALKSGSFLYNVCAIGIILLTIVIGLLGEKVSKVADNASSLFKVVALVVFVIGGIAFIKPENLSFSQSYDIAKVNAAFVSAFYLYAGFSFLPVAAQRMEDPQKNLPKILVAVLLFCSVIFMLVTFVAIGDLGPAMAGESAPLATIFGEHYGNVGKMAIILGMAGSILGVILSMGYNTPFIASSLASEHQLLPAFFGKTTKDGIPYVSVALTGALAVVLVLSGGYLFLVPLCVLIGLVQYVTTSLATFKAQREKGDQTKGEFRLKFGVLIPVLALVFCVYMLVNMQPKVLILGAILFVAGLVIYVIEAKAGKGHPTPKTPAAPASQGGGKS